MIVLNGIEFAERHEKPAAGGKVGLRAFFYNDGQAVDPYDISSVSIFKYDSYASSALFVASSNLLKAEPLMQFGFNDTETYPQAASEYDGTWGGGSEFSHASGIFKLGNGDFVAPLALDTALSGVWETDQLEASSNVSTAERYIDVWTVKLLAGSKYQSFIHNWSLYEDTFFAFTEPLLLTTSNKLMNKHVRYGEVIDLKVTTEATVQNESIPHSIQNIFKESVVSGATVTIKKVNQDPTLETTTVVPAVEMQVTKDNTLIYNWDTTATIATPVQSATFGSPTGTYSVQVTYTALNQTIISPLFYLTVS